MRVDASTEHDECPPLYEKVKSHLLPYTNFHCLSSAISSAPVLARRQTDMNWVGLVLVLIVGGIRPLHSLPASQSPSDLYVTSTTATHPPEVTHLLYVLSKPNKILNSKTRQIQKSRATEIREETQVELFKEKVDDWAHSILLSPNSTKSPNRRLSRSVCRISEFSCGKGKCIPSSKYCDGTDDCQDGLASDEPLRCTPCNRTYYGEWGSTYSISLSSESMSGGYHYPLNHQPPSSPSKPPKVSNHFVCQLTFAAAGDDFGDLVQIIFDSINIGQLTSPTVDGCSDGSLQVAEISRPITGGQWCGFGSGYAVYYSEMSAVALTLSIGGNTAGGKNESEAFQKSGSETVRTMTKGDKTVISGASSQQPLEFEFKIRYKFIPRGLALVRYGVPSNPIERGELVPGTYCSRVFDTCHQKPCKLQTPNYPGLYPRNVTCYFTIRQREIPTCKRVLIQISQRNPHKVQLRGIPGGRAGSGVTSELSSHADTFMAWDDCTGTTDTLIIYDGTTTDDPILLKICSTATLPPITSSGPEVLVAFHATPYGNPLESKPPPPYPMSLSGFELDVDVVIVDSLSADYSNKNYNCTFYFVSEKGNEASGGGEYKAQEYGGNWIARKYGTVTSPRHTLSPRTTCRYEFRGSKYENIWIYFVAYTRQPLKDSKDMSGNCSTRLRIMDGLDMRNEVLLGTYCDTDLPRLCDHKALANGTRDVRACTGNESYISAGSRLIVEQQFHHGTGLRPLHYQFNYEFVTRHVGNDGTCHRHYTTAKMKKRGTFRTTDNVFDFGRGGKTKLFCIYTISLAPYESLHLTVTNTSFGDRQCKTVVDAETGRYTCQYSASVGSSSASEGQGQPVKAEIRLYEYIWTNSNLSSHHHCICGNTSGQSVTFLGRKVEFVFTVENMRNEDSHETFFALFNYLIGSGGCHSDNHFMRTEAGLISLSSTFLNGVRDRPPSCDYYPWLIEASDGHSLYVRVPGSPMMDERKHTPSMSFGRNGSLTLPTYTKSTGSTTGTTGSTHIPLIPIQERQCATTKNRIFVYNQDGQLVQKICPASAHQMTSRPPPQTVEIYSEDFSKFMSPLYPPPKIQFVIEFVGRELGSYRIHWLEVMSIKMKAAVQAMEKESTRMGAAAHAAAANFNRTSVDKKDIFSPFDDPFFKSMFENGDDLGRSIGGTPGVTDTENSHLVGPTATKPIPSYAEVCQYFCPELQACISEKLWCNGIVDCPVSLQDEKSCDSFWLTVNQFMSPAVYLPIAAALTSAIVCCLMVLICIGLRRLCLGSTKGHGGGSSRTSTIDSRRRLPPPRDLFLDPHDPDS